MHYNTDEPLQRPLGFVQLGLQPGLILPGAVGLTESLPLPKVEDPSPEPYKSASLATTSDCDEAAIRTVECKLQECPEFIHDEMMQLFPETKVDKGQLRLIILTEKTCNDMTSWSSAVEEEREDLLAHVRA